MKKTKKTEPERGTKDVHPEDPQKPQQFNVSEQAIPETQSELFDFLVKGPELRIKQRSSKETQEKEFEKLAILGASSLAIEQIRIFVLFTAKEHKVTFPQTFYKEIFRLKGWKAKGANIYRKPWLTARYTLEVIYGRFTKDIVTAIQLQNPYIIPGVRRFKYFQYLNDGGQQKLEQFIEEAIVVMKESATWYEFRIKMFEKHGLPYQIEMFN